MQCLSFRGYSFGKNSVAYICINTVFYLKCIRLGDETSQTSNLIMYFYACAGFLSVFIAFSNVASVVCCVVMLDKEKNFILFMQTCIQFYP